jgi:hypothetical protein
LIFTSLLAKASEKFFRRADGIYWIYNARFEKMAGQRRLFILPFEINWSADIKADGRFHDLKIEKIEKLAASFSPPTQEDIKSFRLEGEDA